MPRNYCSWALFAFLAFWAAQSAAPSAQQPAATPAQPPVTTGGTETHGYIVFIRGTAIGREDVTTQTTATGTVISGRGRLSPPLDVVTRRAEVRYKADWTPESLALEGTVGGGEFRLLTTFQDGQAFSETMEGAQTFRETDKVSAQTIVVPNLFFGTYEALARRLGNIPIGTELPTFIAPQAEFPMRVIAVRTERVQTGGATLNLRRYDLTVANPGGNLVVQLSTDEAGRMVRLTVPAQSLDVVREDVAASTSRTVLFSNPADDSITIPANGFNIAATTTRPKQPAAKMPAVVLVTGSGVGDRDGAIGGIPVMGQLAGALADAGFFVIRYDKRGYGQTGGRSESATLSDFAEDARTVVKFTANRKDVDSKRITVIGHGEGAWVALLAGSRDGRIGAIVSLAGPASTGAELILEQQRVLLQQMNVPDAERQAKIELQKQIHAAVISGTGWEQLPPAVRRQAESTWFQSMLTFDPAKVVKDIDQPLLIMHGALDDTIPPSHADRLADMARKTSDSKAVELISVRGVNHLFVRIIPAEGNGAPQMETRLDAAATNAIRDWLNKNLPARR